MTTAGKPGSSRAASRTTELRTPSTRPASPISYHPLLFTLYPLVFLFAENVDEAQASDLVRSALICLAGLALTYVVCRLLVRDRMRAAIVTSLVVAGVFAYGHAVAPLRGVELGGYIIGRGALLVPLWSLLFAFLIWKTLTSRRDLSSLNSGLNAASLVLVALSLMQIFMYEVRPHSAKSGAWQKYVSNLAHTMPSAVSSEQPDIYFIVLDEYTSEWALRDVFGYDNSSFIRFLRSRGFYVADDSHSHYMFTYASLASTLNMGYLQDLAVACGDDPGKALCGDMIEDSLAILLAKRHGYKFYMLPSEFYVTNRNRNADKLFRRRNGEMNEFERVLFGTTILRPMTGGIKNHRLNRLYKIRVLGDLARMPGPKLVFAHFIMPHPPYVFAADGSVPKRGLLDRHVYAFPQIKALYSGQVEFLNSQLQKIILKIQQTSDRPPVIIIQGDHGFRHEIDTPASGPHDLPPRERSAILNAVYFPDGKPDGLSPKLGPVNTFRIMFNRYFGTDYPAIGEETFEVETVQQRYTIKRVASWDTPQNVPQPSRPRVSP